MQKAGLYQRLQELLIEARKDAGLTQVQLAKKLRKPQSYVSKYENGERRLDVIEFLEVVALLGRDPASILEELAKSSREFRIRRVVR